MLRIGGRYNHVPNIAVLVENSRCEACQDYPERQETARVVGPRHFVAVIDWMRMRKMDKRLA
jgi:hypothetical protein